MAFDDYFKQLFKKEYGDAIKSEISVGALEKSFDLWIQGTHPLIQSSEMIPALFKHHKDNIIEYKSSHDTYHNSDILKVIGDCFYFSYNRKKHLDYISCDTCVWFIVVNPEGLKLHYQKNRIKKSKNPGFYFIPNDLLKIKIIVINELEVKEKQNALLLTLSSGETLRRFLRYLIKNEELAGTMQKYLRTKFIIEHRELSEMAEVRELKKKYSFEENVKAAIEELGIKKVVDAVGINKVVDAMGINKVVDAVGIAKVLKSIGIDKIIDTWGIEILEEKIKRKKQGK